MSDERFDEAIRDALLADDPGTVPARLRTRMAMIPDEAAGQTAVPQNPWHERLSRYAVPMGVLAAAAVIAVVFGGIALRGQQVASVAPSAPAPSQPVVSSPLASGVPTASASAAPEASAATSSSPAAASSPTAAPSSSPSPSGSIAIKPALVTALLPGTFALEGDTPQTGYYRSATSPASNAVLGYWTGTSSAKGGTPVVVLAKGHDIGASAVANGAFVWIEVWYTEKPIDCAGVTPCAPHQGQPVSWALNRTTLDGTTTKLDGGVVSAISVSGEAASPLPPAMAAQGDEVAYAVPRQASGPKPDASTIIVRSLSKGSVIASKDLPGYAYQVGIFNQTLIALEGSDAAGAGSVDLGLAKLDVFPSIAQMDSESVFDHVSTASIGDGGTGGPTRIAFTSTDTANQANAVHVMNADTTSEIAIASVPAGAANPYSPVLIGDGVAWFAQVQDNQGAWSTVVNVWHPGWTSARVLTGVGSPDWLGSSGGSLLLGGDLAVSAADLFGK